MKNIDYVIQKTAADLGYPEEKVRAVVMEYWKTGFSQLINLETTTVSIRHVGNFTVSKFKLTGYIKKRIWQIRFTQKNKKITEERRAEKMEFHYTKLKKALYHRNIIAKQYAKMFGNI